MNEGATLTLKATASAPAGLLSYQWTRNSVDLVDDHRIKGATSATLSVKFFGAEDPGVFQCEVRVGNQQAQLRCPYRDSAPETRHGFVLAQHLVDRQWLGE